jgi:hypothetical protein
LTQNIRGFFYEGALLQGEGQARVDQNAPGTVRKNK